MAADVKASSKPRSSTSVDESPVAVCLSVDGVQFCLKPSASSFGVSVDENIAELRVQLTNFNGFLCITKNEIDVIESVEEEEKSSSNQEPEDSETERPPSKKDLEGDDEKSPSKEELQTIGPTKGSDYEMSLTDLKADTADENDEMNGESEVMSLKSDREWKMLMARGFVAGSIFDSQPIQGMKATFTSGLPIFSGRGGLNIGSREFTERMLSEGSSEKTTPLHDVCALPDVTLEKLTSVLDSDPNAATKTNSFGQLPLHILSENEALLQNLTGREIAREFAIMLIDIHPEGITAKDEEDHMPFTGIVDQWVDHVYRRAHMESDQQPLRSNHPSIESTGVRVVTRFMESQITDENTLTILTSFPYVDFNPEVEWCLQMLSESLSLIKTKKHHVRRRHAHIFTSEHGLIVGTYKEAQEEILSIRTALTENLASIPFLMKTLLLIEDDEVRQRILRLPIIRNACLCPATVGQWICGMLLQRRGVSERGVDYFVVTSSVTITDFVGRNRSPVPKSIEAFHDARETVISELAKVKGLIPSLVVLSKNEIERASSTEVVWKALNSSLQRPFVIGLFSMDFALNFTMIIAFRFDVRIAEQDGLKIIDESFLNGTVQVICVYFLIRATVDTYSLGKVSPQIIVSYYTNFWRIIDLAAIVLSFAASFLEANEAIPGLLALAVGLLWLKTLGFLKSMNLFLATFILALVEIVKDIRWFLVVLSVAIFMFADMLHISTQRANDGLACSTDDESLMAPEAFCGSSLVESYLKLYSVVVGDVTYSDFDYNSGSKLLFVFFTFLCVIILLNVLIAIVSASHTRLLENSRKLFGRARVDFAVTHLSQEKALLPSSRSFRSAVNDPDFYDWALGRVGRTIVLASYITTAFVAEVFMILLAIDIPQSVPLGTSIVAIICIALFIVVLAVGLVAIIQFSFSGFSKHVVTPAIVKPLLSVLKKVYVQATRFVTKVIFDTTVPGNEVNDNADHQIMDVMDSIAEAERNISRSIKSVERSVKELSGKQ